MSFGIEPLSPAHDKFSLGSLGETAFSLSLNFLHSLLARTQHAAIVEIGSDDEACATRSCMAMHENSLAHLVKSAQILTDHHNMLVVWAG